MKRKLTVSSLPLLALFLALAPTAMASTTWYVNGVSGSDSNNCISPATPCKTIGHAISLASSGDSIMVAAATYRENLFININIRLKIIGFSAGTTILDGGRSGTVVSIFNTRASVVLSGMTIRNGSPGVHNGGTLTIISTTISGNGFGAGGGIFNTGTLTIYNSTISGNDAHGDCNIHFTCYAGIGGGIYNDGTLTINNSTVSGNVAKCPIMRCVTIPSGGGIYSNPGTLTISNSTISGNGADIGGGIYGQATLRNSIVANNFHGNCSGLMVSKGYNLSSDNTCNFNGPGDMNSTNPMLGTLGNYGGPTQTIPLLPGSPAIDAGNPNGCKDSQDHLLKTDQRGMPRPDREDQTGCDMGAYEKQSD